MTGKCLGRLAANKPRTAVLVTAIVTSTHSRLDSRRHRLRTLTMTSISYYRRFRMELVFADQPLPPVVLPKGFELNRWDPRDLYRHAVAKFRAFRAEIDANMFDCFKSLAGCERLMLEISGQKSFLPAATWLMSRTPDRRGFSEDVGTIQGLCSDSEFGTIQNIGIIPDCRGLGLGRALLLQSLHGFRARGIPRVYLEATAENETAISLYRTIGFRLIRTSYKEVPVYDKPQR